MDMRVVARKLVVRCSQLKDPSCTDRTVAFSLTPGRGDLDRVVRNVGNGETAPGFLLCVIHADANG